MSRTNLSDRKVIDTGRGSVDNPDYRLPEVQVVGTGYEVVPDTSDTAPDPGGDVDDLGVPRSIQVEEQNMRVQPDGSAVVDVVLSYEEAEGASRHELRISKL